MSIIVKVGCCGFPGSMSKYFRQFKVVEVQRTFYKPPRETTVKDWKAKAPPDFEFTIKVWQVITHPPTSPTYRKAKLSFSNNDAKKVGFFKPSDIVFEAWRKIRDICQILDSKMCVFQTPASFKPTDENIDNMKNFFKKIDRGNLILGWEPRGSEWTDNVIKDLCTTLNLLHIVDPFKTKPVVFSQTLYFRLHGSPPGKKLYSYKYTENDFIKLNQFLINVRDNFNIKEIYVMFNNIYMQDDALAFIEYLKKKGDFKLYGVTDD
ncbi:MAG: DUF72 domain-containing protein [Candidatus Asgardarchaeia archaeon]